MSLKGKKGPKDKTTGFVDDAIQNDSLPNDGGSTGKEAENAGNATSSNLNLSALERYERNMEAMMVQLTNVISMVQDRDREIARLREDVERAKTPVTTSSAESSGERKIPYSEISSEIPSFGNDTELFDVENWIKRIEDIKEIYHLDDRTIKVLATNKLIANVKKWYDSSDDFYKLNWQEFTEALKDMFANSEDTGKKLMKLLKDDNDGNEDLLEGNGENPSDNLDCIGAMQSQEGPSCERTPLVTRYEDHYFFDR